MGFENQPGDIAPLFRSVAGAVVLAGQDPQAMAAVHLQFALIDPVVLAAGQDKDQDHRGS